MRFLSLSALAVTLWSTCGQAVVIERRGIVTKELDIVNKVLAPDGVSRS